MIPSYFRIEILALLALLCALGSEGLKRILDYLPITSIERLSTNRRNRCICAPFFIYFIYGIKRTSPP